MKIPDNEPLTDNDYWLVTDAWNMSGNKKCKYPLIQGDCQYRMSLNWLTHLIQTTDSVSGFSKGDRRPTNLFEITSDYMEKLLEDLEWKKYTSDLIVDLIF